MKKNVGSIDRGIRIVAGLAIAGLGIFYGSWWGLLAIVPFATAMLGTCPLFSLFGISTCKTKS